MVEERELKKKDYDRVKWLGENFQWWRLDWERNSALDLTTGPGPYTDRYTERAHKETDAASKNLKDFMDFFNGPLADWDLSEKSWWLVRPCWWDLRVERHKAALFLLDRWVLLCFTEPIGQHCFVLLANVCCVCCWCDVIYSITVCSWGAGSSLHVSIAANKKFVILLFLYIMAFVRKMN